MTVLVAGNTASINRPRRCEVDVCANVVESRHKAGAQSVIHQANLITSRRPSGTRGREANSRDARALSRGFFLPPVWCAPPLGAYGFASGEEDKSPPDFGPPPRIRHITCLDVVVCHQLVSRMCKGQPDDQANRRYPPFQAHGWPGFGPVIGHLGPAGESRWPAEGPTIATAACGR